MVAGNSWSMLSLIGFGVDAELHNESGRHGGGLFDGRESVYRRQLMGIFGCDCGPSYAGSNGPLQMFFLLGGICLLVDRASGFVPS